MHGRAIPRLGIGEWQIPKRVASGAGRSSQFTSGSLRRPDPQRRTQQV